MAQLVAVFTLLSSAGYAAVLRRHTCPQVCDVTLCPALPLVCYYGQVKDACGCCAVCAPGEGEVCGVDSLLCGDGLRCDSGGGEQRGSCVCGSYGPVCGSDRRTYPSICSLRADNRRAELVHTLPVILIRTGRCETEEVQHPESVRYRFNFIADVVDKIIPAVVHLEFIQGFSGEEVSVSSASGFVISEEGWIITNAHVLSNKDRVKVELRSGLQYDATVEDIDPKMDIALIKIKPEMPLPVLHLGQSSDLRPGEFVVAVGSPFTLQSTVTTGIISMAQRTGLELGLTDSNMDYIQTDAMINYGSSGGPLVNLDGDVIGINTLKVAAGISFAIPVDKIYQFLSESHIRRVSGNTTQRKKHIGVRMLQLSPTLIQDLKEHDSNFPDVSWGVYVYEVLPGAAASRAGMINSDIITSINGQPAHTMEEVSGAVQGGGVLTVVVRRKDGNITLTVVPEESR